jgi:hypothetical protein
MTKTIVLSKTSQKALKDYRAAEEKYHTYRTLGVGFLQAYDTVTFLAESLAESISRDEKRATRASEKAARSQSGLNLEKAHSIVEAAVARRHRRGR